MAPVANVLDAITPVAATGSVTLSVIVHDPFAGMVRPETVVVPTLGVALVDVNVDGEIVPVHAPVDPLASVY
jgi:hypothetical protein